MVHLHSVLLSAANRHLGLIFVGEKKNHMRKFASFMWLFLRENVIIWVSVVYLCGLFLMGIYFSSYTLSNHFNCIKYFTWLFYWYLIKENPGYFINCSGKFYFSDHKRIFYSQVSIVKIQRCEENIPIFCGLVYKIWNYSNI